MSQTSRAVAWALSHATGKVLALSIPLLLTACTVQTRVYAPPPRRVYIAPPVVSAAVVAPGVEVSITATEPPPPLPDYEQPPCPEDGYLWTPGYWHYGPAGYYWVPGTWVQPPQVGVLWTPGYWGFNGGVYGFHAGYWGPTIGFYGGVNYGFGYGGVGFAGGRWEGGHYAYNTAVNNVSVTNVHNTYNQTVVNNVTVTRVSYNGGAGGVTAVASAQERAAAQQPHIAPTSAQISHVQEASRNPALSARTNGGHPAIAATPRPGAFSAPGVVGAHGAVRPAVATLPAENNAGPHLNNAATATPRPPTAPAALSSNKGNGVQSNPGNNLNHPQFKDKAQPVKPQTVLAKRPPPKPNNKSDDRNKEHAQ